MNRVTESAESPYGMGGIGVCGRRRLGVWYETISHTTKTAPESGFSTVSAAEGRRGPRRSSLEGVID